MICPNCGSENVDIINESYTYGKDYGVGKGLCGYVLLGPVGLLCGLCGEGKQEVSTNYWICNRCGHKWAT